MRPRTTMRLYQSAARAWLTAGALSLLLPSSARLGIWLPLHLTLAGAVATAISGAMQNFASALTATPSPPAWAVSTQLVAVTAGAGLIAAGYPSRHRGLVALGGAAFLLGMALLGWFVVRAWRRALNRRHGLSMAMYGCAVAAILIGGTIGALIGSGAVHDTALWLALRRAHMTLNLLGFVSVTIAGTLVTLLPTVLRIQMPRWHGGATAALLVGGAAGAAAGLALASDPLALGGAVAFALGAAGLVWMVVVVAGSPRTWPVAISAKHLMAAVAWFAAGSLVLAVSLAGGARGFDASRPVLLAILVVGWIVQTLLGAWLYLLPMARPGHPDVRRRELAAIEFGGTLQLLALNGGVGLVALRAAGWVPTLVGAIGTGLAIGGGAIALLKAWASPALAAAPLPERHRAVWGA